VTSLALSRLVSDLLFEVQPRDVWTYVTVCLLLAASALAAALLPARRAARVDPLEALRAE
jgi:ABC-type lipoprotein release transport system permease subunit